MSRRRGFTLIEILVVIAIIALLAAILMPTLAKAREHARCAVCRSNMRDLMVGQEYYANAYGVLPATQSTFYENGCWPLPDPDPNAKTNLTWEGAKGSGGYYAEPFETDPKFIRDVPRKGTIFTYVNKEGAYTCPSDSPGASNATALGGGGNGRLSYSMNAYIGGKKPAHLRSFTYIEAVNNAPLPVPGEARDFAAGQRVNWPTSHMIVLFEEHPYWHLNQGYPEGNFNVTDKITTRHSPPPPSSDPRREGRTNIAFLDAHVETRLYPAQTDADALFTEMGQPSSGGNLDAFVVDLDGCPW